MNQLKPYFILMKVLPNPDNPKGKDISGANAHLWVFENSGNEAEKKATRYLNQFGWNIEEGVYTQKILSLDNTIARCIINS